MLAENFKGKTFRVYGLDLPGIREVRPTNIPAVKANELHMDNLFELEDDTVAMVDYESDYDGKDKVKYLNYLTGIANIRRAIEMTQVAMIFKEEKQQAVKEAVEVERMKAAASDKQIMIKMIDKGYSTDEIVFLVSGYSKNDVKALRKTLQDAKNNFQQEI